MSSILRKLTGKAIRLTLRGLPRGPHITRYYMYKRISEVMHGHRHTHVLSISGSGVLCSLLDYPARVTEANYPQHNILALPFANEEFDCVVSDQVLEHVEGSPQTAIDETLRVLKPGGFAIHTTCFINPIHNCPFDFWRFTPDGLRFLCRGFSRIVQVDGWGNPYVWMVIWAGLRFEGIPETPWHPLRKLAMLNRTGWPIVTWVVAQK